MKTPAPHILVIEDTPELRRVYEEALENEGYDVTGAGTGQAALAYLKENTADIVLLDLKLPDMNGLEILQSLQKQKILLPVIVITGYGSINTAIDAMRSGARDFLVKPFDIERLCGAVKTELEKNPLDTMPAELAGLPAAPLQNDSIEPIKAEKPHRDPPRNFGGFIGTSPIMQKIYEQIESAAKSNATVFITGESGTGKEVCAEAIHKHSARAGGPFVPINCAAIPRDLMESELFGHVKGAFTGAITDREGAAKLADGGTLFLDEIAEMNPDMQTKLLRFLQNLTFQKVGGNKPEKTDTRIICATNRNPVAEIRDGRLREDLFYRLHVLPLYMPPLRERGDDIIDIAHTLLRRYAAEEGKDFQSFAPDSEQALRHYRWPGNIRQLQNVVRQAIVMHNGQQVGTAMLPPELWQDAIPAKAAMPPAGTSLSVLPTRRTIQPLAQAERDIIENAIALCNGNIPQAAAALEISPSTIYRKKANWEKPEKEALFTKKS